MEAIWLKRSRASALVLTAASLPVFGRCAGAGWLSALLGGVLAACLLTTLDRLLGERSLSEAADLGRAGSIAAGILAVALVGLALWTGWRTGFAFRETAGNPLAVWLVLALAWAAAKHGTAVPARCASVLLPLLAALYGAVLIFSLPELRLDWLRPRWSLREVLRCCAYLLLPGAALCCAGRQSGALTRGAWASALLAAWAAAVTGGLLSPALASEPNGFLTASRSVSLFGVMQRFEALISAARLMSGFCLCALLLAACRCLIGGLTPPRAGDRIFNVIPVVLIPLCIIRIPNLLRWSGLIAICSGLPAGILLCLGGKRNFQKKQKNT